MILGNYIWAGSQKVGKFEELVAMEADGELSRVGVAIVGDWVFTLVLGGNQCFVKVLGQGLHLGERGRERSFWGLWWK